MRKSENFLSKRKTNDRVIVRDVNTAEETVWKFDFKAINPKCTKTIKQPKDSRRRLCNCAIVHLFPVVGSFYFFRTILLLHSLGPPLLLFATIAAFRNLFAKKDPLTRNIRRYITTHLSPFTLVVAVYNAIESAGRLRTKSGSLSFSRSNLLRDKHTVSRSLSLSRWLNCAISRFSLLEIAFYRTSAYSCTA